MRGLSSLGVGVRLSFLEHCVIIGGEETEKSKSWSKNKIISPIFSFG
jgi:hypothetical protein